MVLVVVINIKGLMQHTGFQVSTKILYLYSMICRSLRECPLLLDNLKPTLFILRGFICSKIFSTDVQQESALIDPVLLQEET